MDVLHADDVKAAVFEPWERVARAHPHDRPTVVIPAPPGVRLDRSFRKDVRAWDFVHRVEWRRDGPHPYENGGGTRWLYFHCASLDEVRPVRDAGAPDA